MVRFFNVCLNIKIYTDYRVFYCLHTTRLNVLYFHVHISAPTLIIPVHLSSLLTSISLIAADELFFFSKWDFS